MFKWLIDLYNKIMAVDPPNAEELPLELPVSSKPFVTEQIPPFHICLSEEPVKKTTKKKTTKKVAKKTQPKTKKKTKAKKTSEPKKRGRPSRKGK